ncbi:hypothetical protein ACTFIW_003970 [Dictyostelium discoideum]
MKNIKNEFDNNERLFWKVFKDKFLFNYIFNQMIATEINYKDEKKYYVGNRIQWKYIKSIEWMISNNQITLFKDKLKSNQYIIVDYFSLEIFIKECKDIELMKLLIDKRGDDLPIESLVSLSLNLGNIVACSAFIDLNLPFARSSFTSAISIGNLQIFKKLLTKLSPQDLDNPSKYPKHEIFQLIDSNNEIMEFILLNENLYSKNQNDNDKTQLVSIQNYFLFKKEISKKLLKLNLVNKNNDEENNNNNNNNDLSIHHLILRIIKNEPLEIEQDELLFLIESYYLVCLNLQEIPIQILDRIEKIKLLDTSRDNEITKRYHLEMILVEQLQDKHKFSEHVYKLLYKTNNLSGIRNMSSLYHYSYKSLCMDGLCLLMSYYKDFQCVSPDQLTIRDCKVESCDKSLIDTEPDRVIAFLQLYYAKNNNIRYLPELDKEFIAKVFVNCSIEILETILTTNSQFNEIFGNLHLGEQYTIPFSKYSWFIKRYCQCVNEPNLSFFNCNIEFKSIQEKKDFIDILSIYQTQSLNLPFNSIDCLGSIETCDYYTFKIPWNIIPDIYKFAFNYSLSICDIIELNKLQSIKTKSTTTTMETDFKDYQIEFKSFNINSSTSSLVLSLFKFINLNESFYQNHLFHLIIKFEDIIKSEEKEKTIKSLVNVIDFNKFQFSTINLLLKKIIEFDLLWIQLIFESGFKIQDYNLINQVGIIPPNVQLFNVLDNQPLGLYQCKISNYQTLLEIIKLLNSNIPNEHIHRFKDFQYYLYLNLLSCNGVTISYLKYQVLKVYPINQDSQLFYLNLVIYYLKIKSTKLFKYIIENEKLINYICNNGNGLFLLKSSFFSFNQICNSNFQQLFFEFKNNILENKENIKLVNNNNINYNYLQTIYNINYLLSVGEIDIILENKNEFIINNCINEHSMMASSNNAKINSINSSINSLISKINEKLMISTPVEKIKEFNENIIVDYDGKDIFKSALNYERLDVVQWLMTVNSFWIEKLWHRMVFGNHLEISKFIYKNYSNEFTIDQLSLNEILNFGYQNMFDLIIKSSKNISPTIQKLKNQLDEKDEIIKNLNLQLSLLKKRKLDDLIDDNNGFNNKK